MEIAIYFIKKIITISEASMERDKFMSPVDAKEFGIIDTILNHPPKMGFGPADSEENKN